MSGHWSESNNAGHRTADALTRIAAALERIADNGEELKEHRDISHRFACLLDNLTDGKFSKLNYEVNDMVRFVEETQEEHTQRAIQEALDDRDTEQAKSVECCDGRKTIGHGTAYIDPCPGCVDCTPQPDGADGGEK